MGTYNALRIVQEFWDKTLIEKLEIPAELDALVIAARKRYHETEKEKSVQNTRKRTYAKEMRVVCYCIIPRTIQRLPFHLDLPDSSIQPASQHALSW